MKHKDFTGIVPAQYTGKEVEAEASVECKDENDAKMFYNVSKERLLNVNNWHKIAGIISARFQLIDPNGKEISGNAEKNDYIKVDIPGPGSKEGDGFDWVCIEELKEIDEANVQSTGFRVRPSHNPLGDKNNIAHFDDDAATSNFIVTREGIKVSAVIIDRNVKPNDDTESATDKIRHTAIGMSAIGAFSKLQWQNLADGLVKQKE
jgi:hypothetical protein